MTESGNICPLCQATLDAERARHVALKLQGVVDAQVSAKLAATEHELGQAHLRREQEIRVRQEEIERREAALTVQRESVLQREVAVQTAIEHKARELAQKAAADAAATTRKHYEIQMDQLRQEAHERTQALEAARQREAGLAMRERALAERELTAKTDVERQKTEAWRDAAAKLETQRVMLEKVLGEQLAQAVAQKDAELDGLKKQVEILNRKATAVTPVVRGQLQERGLEAGLREAFLGDQIARVAPGTRGGDIRHGVIERGREVGRILYESKDVQHWKEAWVKKLAEDGRRAEVNVCVLVTRALPAGVEDFEIRDDVYVVHPTQVLVIARLLRGQLVALAAQKALLVGSAANAVAVQGLLVSQPFINEIRRIVKVAKGEEDRLRDERVAMEKLWGERQLAAEAQVDAMTRIVTQIGAALGQGLTVPELELPGAATRAGR